MSRTRKFRPPEEDFDPDILTPHQIDEDGLAIEIPRDPEEDDPEGEERDLDFINEYFSDGKENNDG